jgi:fumarate hydratase class I
MNAPAEITPPYRHTPLFPLGQDTAPYRKLSAEGVRLERAGGRDLVVVEREALRALAGPPSPTSTICCGRDT